jgi:hypothetical protein
VTKFSGKTIKEPGNEIKVLDEADVVVVGGGPAGVCAAVAAAREGARTVLIERYGHLGGMATGGLVILIPHMSGGTREQQIAGLCQEWIDRLDKLGGALHPEREELGSSDPAVLKKWQNYFSVVVDNKVRQTVMVDPELLKCVLNDMVLDSGVKLLLHSWGCRAIVNKKQVQGVIFESKSGRQAILGKITIDTTGDGDLFCSAGVAFDGAIDRKLRNSQLALVFRMANVDYSKYCDYINSSPDKRQEVRDQLKKIAGFSISPLPSNRNDIVWVNNWLIGLDPLKVEDLTSVEIEVRKIMLPVHQFLKKNVPGFENSFILDTASQTGTRGSRRLTGEYVLSREDMHTGKTFEDTIAVFPGHAPSQGGMKHVSIPYRSLVPKYIEGFLAAGRCFSSDNVTNDMYNLIPHCAAMGQAAGTAAAIAIKNNLPVRQVDHGQLQSRLRSQGVFLP